jgi:hypothetical protein
MSRLLYLADRQGVEWKVCFLTKYPWLSNQTISPNNVFLCRRSDVSSN